MKLGEETNTVAFLAVVFSDKTDHIKLSVSDYECHPIFKDFLFFQIYLQKILELFLRLCRKAMLSFVYFDVHPKVVSIYLNFLDLIEYLKEREGWIIDMDKVNVLYDSKCRISKYFKRTCQIPVMELNKKF